MLESRSNVDTIIKFIEHYLNGINLYDLIFSIFSKDIVKQNISLLRRFVSDEQNSIFIYEAVDAFCRFLANYNQEELDRSTVKSLLVWYARNSKEVDVKDKSILYWIAILGFSSFLLRKNINAQIEEYKSIDERYSIRSKLIFYRGQSDFSWPMTASILRGFNFTAPLYFDNNFYVNLTINNGLDDKFNKMMRHYLTPDFSGLYAYQKYAFFQHACSYSPLIDLTNDGIVALSFALSNKNNINNFFVQDSCIFEIQCESENNIILTPKEASLFLKNSMRIFVLNSNCIYFGKIYTFVNSSGDSITKDATTYENIYTMLRPDFKIIVCPTNDRMHYQSGAFVVFYNCVTLRERAFYELNNELDIKKRIILKQDKKELLESIYKNYREKDIAHLMDPYLYFKE